MISGQKANGRAKPYRVPLQAPDKFYKRESQEKHFACDRIFSWLPAPVIEQDVFLPSAP
jgi:hypothetical protein